MTNESTFSEIVSANRANIGFIVGNGINQYNAINTGNSWNDLLVKLWNKHTPSSKSKIPAGIALTEFYDVLDLKQKKNDKSTNLQREFCQLVGKWRSTYHHRLFLQWAVNNPRAPDAGGWRIDRVQIWHPGVPRRVDDAPPRARLSGGLQCTSAPPSGGWLVIAALVGLHTRRRPLD